MREAEPNPDGCAKEQPLKQPGAADRIRLECSEAPFDRLRVTKCVTTWVRSYRTKREAERNEAVFMDALAPPKEG